MRDESHRSALLTARILLKIGCIGLWLPFNERFLSDRMYRFNQHFLSDRGFLLDRSYHYHQQFLSYRGYRPN